MARSLDQALDAPNSRRLTAASSPLMNTYFAPFQGPAGDDWLLWQSATCSAVRTALPCDPFPERRLRRDLIVQSKGTDGIQHHVIPVFATIAKSKLLTTPRERLEQRPLVKSGGSRFLVVPPLSAASGDERGVRAVKLDELLTILGSPSET